jgi:hypothetical protein
VNETKQAARRRLVFAFAIALALHEIAALAYPWWRRFTPPPQPVERFTIAKLIRIEHRATPTPPPTPKPVVHAIGQTNVAAHIVNPGRSSEKQPIKRIASARAIAHTKYHLKPIIHVPAGGHGAGTAVAKADTGSLGNGGNGTGESGNGNGGGGAAVGQEPCGAVDFLTTTQPTIDSSTGRVWEHIMIQVHFADGTSQTVPLDYPFYYPSQAVDPFLQSNVRVADFQFPPAAQAASEPPLVQYVIAHTRADGTTKLRDCPGIPTPQPG